MTNSQVIKIIEKEFKVKTLGVTEQYLEIHSPIYIDNKLKIDLIEKDNTNKLIIAYLPVLDEKFYFVVYININSKEVTGFETEACNRVYFNATSIQYSEEQLKAMTKLIPTDCWNKGDFSESKNYKYNYSSIEFLPNPEPDNFENKLRKLLDFLEKDREGIKLLVDKADGYIVAAIYTHNSNGMIGGPEINSECIRRMNDLNLQINFDIYLEGKMFR